MLEISAMLRPRAGGIHLCDSLFDESGKLLPCYFFDVGFGDFSHAVEPVCRHITHIRACDLTGSGARLDRFWGHRSRRMDKLGEITGNLLSCRRLEPIGECMQLFTDAL